MDRNSYERTVATAGSKYELWLVEALALRRVVVTRSGLPGDALVRRFNELGANVLHYPALSFVPPHNVAPFRDAVENIARFDWVVFTSANAVQAVSDQVLELHGHLQVKLPAIAAVGPATSEAIRALGWVVHFVAGRGGGLALATDLPVDAGSTILLPRADIASADLPNVLRDRDCIVREVVAYRTLPNHSTSLSKVVEHRNVDALTFTSPSTVAAFVSAAKVIGWDLNVAQHMGRMIIACIGETTAGAVQRHGLAVDVVATEQTSDGLVEAVARALYQRQQNAGFRTHDLGIF